VGTNRGFWCGDPNHLIVNCPTRTTQPSKDHAQVPKQGKTIAPATVINKKQTDDSGTVVPGTLTFNSTPLIVLFDSRTTHSFISSHIASQIGVESYKHPGDLYVSVPTEKTIKCDVMHKSCPITLDQEEFKGDLIQLDLPEFDIILGMDWLPRYRVKINCQKQRVPLKGRGGRKIYFLVDNSSTECPVISSMAARKLVRQGCVACVCCLTKDRKEEVKLKDILVVREFPDMFPKKILKVPSEREIDFEIELKPGARPISKPPYRMAQLS